MRWSKIKQMLESRFAEELQGRLKVELTKYRKPTRSENGELFIVLDGSKIFSAAEFKAIKQSQNKYYRDRDKYHEMGITSEFDALADLTQSLSWSVDELFEQPNPLLRGLAVADSRFGKRRIRQIAASEESDFVQAILYARGASDTSTK